MMKQNIKAGEGIFINLPNGKEALRLISYRESVVKVIQKDNMVRVLIEFNDPFIHPTDKTPKVLRRKKVI
jgi:hypothetical protein